MPLNDDSSTRVQVRCMGSILLIIAVAALVTLIGRVLRPEIDWSKRFYRALAFGFGSLLLTVWLHGPKPFF